MLLLWTVFTSIVVLGRAVCYLEDSAATCAVCWKTTSAGLTTMAECPADAIQIQLETYLPNDLVADTEYKVGYTFRINTSVFPVLTKFKKGNSWMVPHSNVHSCIRSRGACTPFVSNTPGLSTHTPELRGNGTFVSGGDVLLETFDTTVTLPEDEYTIILHGRFYIRDTLQTADQDCYPDCLIKYDAAVGMIKSVVPGKSSPSSDAYVSAGAVCAVLLLSLGSTVWGARTGRLKIAELLQAATRPEVTLTGEMVMLFGDVIAFTMTVIQEVLVDVRLVDIIPISILVLVMSWLVTIYLFAQTVRDGRDLLRSHMDPQATMNLAAADVLKQLGLKETSEDYDRKFSTILGCPDCGSLLPDNADIRRELKSAYRNVLSLVFADLPLTVIAAYIVKTAGAADFMVLIALVLSSIGAGGKFVRLGHVTSATKALKMQQLYFATLLLEHGTSSDEVSKV